MIRSLPREKRYAVATTAIFVIAILLRLSFALVNRDSNDNHLRVISKIAREGRLPTKDDIMEGVQPKLYHVTVAALLKDRHMSGHRQVLVGQLVNCAAGIITIYLIWIFISRIPCSAKIKFLSFSLVALNPKLIHASVQVTNDAFVILFATATLYNLALFFRDPRPKSFAAMTTFSVLAVLSKSNALPIFPVIVLACMARAIRDKGISGFVKSAWSGYLALFLIIYMPTVAFLGQFAENHLRYGEAFTTHNPKAPKAFFLKHSQHDRPGVKSIMSAFTTFRIVDLVRHPLTSNGRSGAYERHRTSLWSQMYGRAHFIYFPDYPLSWRTTRPYILNMGRAILVFALLPTLAIVIGLIGAYASMIRGYFIDRYGFIEQSPAWIFATAYLFQIALQIAYACRIRDFAAFKALYVAPLAIAFTYFLIYGLTRIYAWSARLKAMHRIIDIGIGALLSLYILSIGHLIRHLAILNAKSRGL